MVFIRTDNRYGYPYSKMRTQYSAGLRVINAEEPAIEKEMVASGIKGFGISGFSGSGIDIFGKGTLIHIDQTMPEELQKSYLIVQGAGVGSFLKDSAKRLVSWGRKNATPILKDTLKALLKTGQRVGADVAVSLADDVSKAGTNLVDKNISNALIANIAKEGISKAGKQVKNRANAYLDEEEKKSPFSKSEDLTANYIAQRSREQLARLTAKNKQGTGNIRETNFIKN